MAQHLIKVVIIYPTDRKILMKNYKEMPIYSVGRTGHHAIAEWIMKYHPGPRLFVDSVLWNRADRERATTDYDIDYATNSNNPYVLNLFAYTVESSDDLELTVDKIKNPDKHIMTMSGNELFRSHYDEKRWIHHPADVIQTVLVIRDIFNWAASRLKGHERGMSPGHCNIENYMTFIDEALNITELIEPPPALILFNKWVTFSTYRISCGRKLGLKGDYDLPYQKIPHAGGGSSFDEFEFDGIASAMNINMRWEEMKHHPIMQ